MGSGQEFDGRPVFTDRSPVLRPDSCCSPFAWGGGWSRSSEGKRDLGAVASDPFRHNGLVPFSDTYLPLSQRLNDERRARDPVPWGMVRRCTVCILLPPWIRMRAVYEVAKPATPRRRRRSKT